MLPLSSRVFRRAAVVTALVPVVAVAQSRAGSADPAITVGSNVQVSLDRPRLAHYEHLAGAHSRDPNKMLACSMVTDPARGHTFSIVYTTVDGGKTWKETLDADLVNGLTGDPVCVYGLGDTAFFVSLTTAPTRMHVHRSTDGGLTWGKATDMPFIDRENLVVDQSGGKFNGRIYINGTGSAPALEGPGESAVTLWRSVDGGKTFVGPALRTASPTRGVVGMGNSVVLSDGQVVTLFGDYDRGKAEEDNLSRGPIASLKVAVSKDGGETYASNAVVSPWYMARLRSQGSHVPWLAVDRAAAAFKDRLYAVWDDYREGRLTVLLSYSSDKGKTWSKPVKVVDDRIGVNPEQEGPDQIMPLVAVNKDGIVGVAWYDRRDQKDNLGWDIRFAASYDGGESFTPSVKVSSAPNRFGGGEVWPAVGSVTGGGTRVNDETPPSKMPLTLSFGVNNFFYSSGHTSGFVATADGTFHPIWEDNRTGVSQLWTAAVTVHGAAVLHGVAELAPLTDVTEKVTLALTDAAFDRGASTVTARMRLKNTSKDTISGPIKVRVVALESDLGIPQLVGATNGVTSKGAVFELSDLLVGGRLLPDSLSGPRAVSIRLSDMRPLKAGGTRPRFGLATLDARVYAGGVRVASAEKPK